MRKHVDGLDPRRAITHSSDSRQVCGEPIRIAGHVHRAARRYSLEDRLEHVRCTAVTGRIEDDRIPRLAADARQHVFDTATDRTNATIR